MTILNFGDVGRPTPPVKPPAIIVEGLNAPIFTQHMQQAQQLLGALMTPIVVADMMRVLQTQKDAPGVWLVPHPQDVVRSSIQRDLVRAHIMIAILLGRLDEPTTDIDTQEAMTIEPGTRILTEEYEGGLRITVVPPKEETQ